MRCFSGAVVCPELAEAHNAKTMKVLMPDEGIHFSSVRRLERLALEACISLVRLTREHGIRCRWQSVEKWCPRGEMRIEDCRLDWIHHEIVSGSTFLTPRPFAACA
eukprot:867609-Amphidinium_carterae.1